MLAAEDELSDTVDLSDLTYKKEERGTYMVGTLTDPTSVSLFLSEGLNAPSPFAVLSPLPLSSFRYHSHSVLCIADSSFD